MLPIADGPGPASRPPKPRVARIMRTVPVADSVRFTCSRPMRDCCGHETRNVRKSRRGDAGLHAPLQPFIAHHAFVTAAYRLLTRIFALGLMRAHSACAVCMKQNFGRSRFSQIAVIRVIGLISSAKSVTGLLEAVVPPRCAESTSFPIRSYRADGGSAFSAGIHSRPAARTKPLRIWGVLKRTGGSPKGLWPNSFHCCAASVVGAAPR
jgi:hypothetical protein